MAAEMMGMTRQTKYPRRCIAFKSVLEWGLEQTTYMGGRARFQ
jgi:hypothetical protein